MKAPSIKPIRCAIYTRVSTEHGLDQEFNSLDAQYDAASAYIKSSHFRSFTLDRERLSEPWQARVYRCRPKSLSASSIASRKMTT